MTPSLFPVRGQKEGSVTLCCFSPPVILLTFTIEAGLAVYAWWRYRSTRFGRLSAVLLVLLSLFQISEWFICQGGSSLLWSRVGFVATAFLPILGLDFVSMLAKKKWPMWLGYALATVISGIFVFLPNAFTAAACTGKFVAFQGGSPALDFLYGFYYVLTMSLGVFLIVRFLKAGAPNRPALAWLLIGYLAFCLPALALYVLVLASRTGAASILCGFAVLLALILALKVLPAAPKA
jgi:hypothetical protein